MRPHAVDYTPSVTASPRPRVAAAAASSAAGGAPLRASPKALRALEEALGLRSTKALRRRGPGGRLIAAPTVGTGVWWRCRGRCLHRPEPAAGGSHCRSRGLVLPPAGHFSPRKSAENAPGAAAPGLPWGCAACIPRRGISQAVAVHRAVPFHTASPFPASRGPVESDSRYGYRGFL